MSYEGWILLTGSLVGISCSIIGCFLILRKMAMLADAISHTVLLGIVAAFLISQSLDGAAMFIGALCAGLLTAFFVQLLSAKGVQSDAAIGVVFTFLFAVGVILLTLYGGNVHLDVNHALMGEITFVPLDIVQIGGVTLGPKAVWMLGFALVVNLLLIGLFYKEFKITSFDPQMAMSLGIPVLLIHYLQMGMLSMTTVASFDSVGAILVVAMLIVPPAAAYLLTEKLSHMLVISGLIGVLSAVSGYYAAVLMNISIAGAMASAAGVIFSLVFLFSPSQGYVIKLLVRRKSSQQLQEKRS
ncbi:iron chelate uptake ABC transporter family permease subunit [Bacillus lacus]|uniref:Iron chelate uptake ABC transporter family permease subunit n=1 Tax=Metabacillus lacus TaxID=1983721 RepID=A0A7X2IZ23_9BACI|nr:metal ABC transporter permease [Metabacillus lacus]MRX72422.1 iron chelate uptake ABC transporter family permease subunit [Metabacillus lacus]